MRSVWARIVWLCLAATTGLCTVDSRSTPPSPVVPSPIAFFRQLLNTNSEGRRLALHQRSDIQRELIQAKLEEYEALPAAEREQRLRATEFRYYLRPLLTAPTNNRPVQLAQVPPEFRGPIGDRLARWDALPENTRQNLQAYDHAVAWLARFQVANRASAGGHPPAPPPPTGTQLEFELARWQALPEAQRDQLCRQFEELLQLPNPDWERTLGDLSPEERRQMEETLQAFARLAPAQRQISIRSFRKFASMSAAERADFLRSADRWREMSPADRAQWRQIVEQLPPLPPGFSTPPPFPPPFPSTPANAALSTKQQ